MVFTVVNITTDFQSKVSVPSTSTDIMLFCGLGNFDSITLASLVISYCSVSLSSMHAIEIHYFVEKAVRMI